MAINLYNNIDDSEIIHKEIEYKELNIEDFWNEEESTGLKTNKVMLDLQDAEYLSDVIRNKNMINYDESNTVVINSSVGQGKSTLAIEVAKDYYLDCDKMGKALYTVIVAVPHKSLVGQYINDIKDKLAEYNLDIDIPDYSNLIQQEENPSLPIIIEGIKNASSKRMHIITINCLLGNSGEDAVEQGFVKREYLNKIITYNKGYNRKIIIIMDEVHDSIHNFKQDLIFNLWKFKTNNVLHKAFILSATFNEASKVVIKYIAELTDKKLQIIESVRKQSIKDLSNLHIHLTKSYSYDFDTEEFIELFEPIIEKHQNTNILSYSKSLCSKLIDGSNGEQIRGLLLSKYKKINVCIPEDDHLSKKQQEKKGIPTEITYSTKYISGVCNVGTVFKTGVSIKEKNSALVIILPSKYSMQGFVKNGDFGIFTNGIISLIQALARVREKADIYVIMPYPKQFIQSKEIENTYIENIKKLDILKSYVFHSSDSAFSYYKYQDQKKLMDEHYNKIKERLKFEIDLVNDNQKLGKREFLPYLQYPTFDMYVLSKGEKMLYSYYAMFGKDLSAYMIWAAFNNQFVNCRLKTISTTKEKIIINIDNVQHFISTYFYENCNLNWLDTKECDVVLYEKLYNRITSEIKISVRKGSEENYTSLGDNILRRHILAFIQKFTKGNKALSQKYMNTIKVDADIQFEDLEFSSGDYLLCSISNVKLYTTHNQNNKPTQNTQENQLIDVYLDLHKVYELFTTNNKMIMKTDDGRSYIYPTFEKYTEPLFTQGEIIFIIRTIKSVIKDQNFKIFRKFQGNLNNTSLAMKAIYKELKEAFFYLTESKISTSSGRVNINYIDIKGIPINRTGINLLYEYEFNTMEYFENKEDYMLAYGDWHEDNQLKQENWEDRPITECEMETINKLQVLVDAEVNIQRTKAELSEKVLHKQKFIESYDVDTIMNSEDIDKKKISENDHDTIAKLKDLLNK